MHFQMEGVKVKRMSPNAKIPKRATPGAAGFDLFAAQSLVIPARGHKCVSTDIQVSGSRRVKFVIYGPLNETLSYLTT